MTRSEATRRSLPAHAPVFPGAHILVVDDEQATRHTLAELLVRMGYQTVEAPCGQKALEHMARQRFDLVILDLKMPGMDGTEVLKAARELAPDTVFIILTGHGTLDSAIASIRHGAFDYLLKPHSIQTIVSAVEAGLAERQRRMHEDPVTLLEQALAGLKGAPPHPETAPPAEHILEATTFPKVQNFREGRVSTPDIRVDVLRRLVIARDHPVDLTPAEFDVLTYLMRHQNRIISCRELVAHVRGYDLDEREARLFVRSHVHRLRHKLEQDPARPSLIRTVRGYGYVFSTNQTETADAPGTGAESILGKPS